MALKSDSRPTSRLSSYNKRRIVLRMIGRFYVVTMSLSAVATFWPPRFANLSSRQYFLVFCGAVMLVPVTALASVWLSPRFTFASKLERTREFGSGFGAWSASLDYLMKGGSMPHER